MFGRISYSILRSFPKKRIAIALVLCTFPLVIPSGTFGTVKCEDVKNVQIDTSITLVESEKVDGEKESSSAPPADDKVDVQIIVTDEECLTNDAEWMAEKEKCAFCKMFIFSPCKMHFKKWSLCVDKAKEQDLDFAAVCSSYTKALMHCTSENTEYFQALEQGDDHGDDSEGHAGDDAELIEPIRDDEK
jgi:hypothetical protein